MTNPFIAYAALVRADYGAARALRALVLHLYHPAHPVDLGYLLEGTDERHRRAALDMLAWFAVHGSVDAAFAALGSGLAEAAEEAAAGG